MKIIIALFTFIIAIIYMIKIKKHAPNGQVLKEPLTKQEKIIVGILCFLNPMYGGATFYYGWKKKLPRKAKQANDISLGCFLIQLVIVIVLSAIGIPVLK